MANHHGEFPNETGPLDEQAQAILLANMRAGSPELRAAPCPYGCKDLVTIDDRCSDCNAR